MMKAREKELEATDWRRFCQKKALPLIILQLSSNKNEFFIFWLGKKNKSNSSVSVTETNMSTIHVCFRCC